MSIYDLPNEIQVDVDGPVRVVRLNRPEQLNARRIAALPQQAVEDTRRVVNLHLERAVLATLDFALAAEDRSFRSPELRANLDRVLRRAKDAGAS
jgi:enoyl-CoA hydratase/carnithine racemase